ncbi:TIR domain-containing protein, partial [Hyalangium minutum]|uniref:TIR domain-containing protein n=1 Tax=Hyalangium minutum TaxID=394096 RepID=UPI0005C4D27D
MAVEPWLEELGKSDRERLEKAVTLAAAGRFRMSDCLNVLFPDKKGREAQLALASFRKRVNDVSVGEDGSGLGLRFEVDSKKKNPPEERFCWFTGPDPAVKQAEKFSDESTADVEGKPLIKAKGLATTTGAVNTPGKRKVRFFVSYAHDNRTLVDALVKELKTHFAASARYELIDWIDQDILLGDKWRQSIEQGIQSCDFGLLMVSPSFFASKFIREKELPHFVGPEDDSERKPVLPVGVVPVSFGSHDLKGLGEHQIFLMRTPRIEGRYYDQMNTGAMKRDFVFKLYLAIEKRLNAFFAPPPAPGPSASPRESKEGDTSTAADHVPVPEETLHYQRNRAHRLALHEMEQLAPADKRRADELQARDALEELETWALNPSAPPFFALLGEYGIGKTTTLKQFTRELMKKRRVDSSVPLPIYVDLRAYVGESKDTVPTIDQLLTSVIERSWKVSHRGIMSQDVLRLVREEGAVILFDGLDEKIVHLSPTRAQDFIRTLWAVLPDAARTRDPLPEGKRRGKLLISCRSHYFRDVASQNAMLVGEHREGIERKNFPALCLLPFTEAQIQSYLADFLGTPARGGEAFEIIQSIHNLRDLAERPYLLSLIGEHLGELESLKARREKVNAARLYELVVRSWINRDNGKHQLGQDHKRQLMEELAAALWREGSKQWAVDRLEAWFDEYLLSNPAIAAAYATKERAVLKEDLRTATFVLRPTDEERHFRFAHTSLQEYFLATYLKRALEEGKLERWALEEVSWETVDFLGQLMEWERDPKKALSAMESILGGDTLSAAGLAFAYWMRALEQGYPAPTPARVKLAGANLEGWRLKGRSASQPLNLRGADLSSARLNRARLEYVELGNAQLTGVQARQAVFLSVSAPRVRAQGSDFRGLRWKRGSLVEADLQGAQLEGCQWIGVSAAGATLPENWEHQASLIHERPSHPRREGSRLMVLQGHAGFVAACGWSPDGKRVVSGADDSTVKVWDAGSGECLLTLSGHAGFVTACGWSPDGKRVVSGASDRTVKVWDAGSGQCLLTLSGHAGFVNACEWSPDGKRVVSGADDSTVKVWDAGSGECLLTLSGHAGFVTACGWSPDGKRVVSGAYDRTVKVWDAGSGQCLLTLSGHAGGVTACGWSPDGKRVVSGADDSTVKVWDAGSGECLLTLSGHAGFVNACGWSPDGKRVVSGAYDRTVKVWDAGSGECLLTLSGHAGSVIACGWSPDGKRVVSGADDSTVKVWDAGSGEC